MERVFLIVLDSLGIGEAPDAFEYGDEGSNTLRAVMTCKPDIKHLKSLGIGNIDSVDYIENHQNPKGAYGRLTERSKGKDTTMGHWEIAGIVSEKALPLYPNGFPQTILEKISKASGRDILCNLPYSGIKVIEDYGQEHCKTGALIVYTSADSVLQIAAHEEIVPIEELYAICEKAREICCGVDAVGRIIARPFLGEYPNFRRTTNRHDYSLLPPRKTMLSFIKEAGQEVISVGKIADIFANQGITKSIKTVGNTDGLAKTSEILKSDFHGLCFVNLVDFDMLYGHRNDCVGYAKALEEFDLWLGDAIKELRDDDILMLTADHGCDPSTISTDHSREYVPIIVYGVNIKPSNLKTRDSFADIASFILDFLSVEGSSDGVSFYNEIIRNKEI